MLSDCAFRAQLVLPEQRLLFDYWQDIAQGRTMPARADFDPLKVPHLLPHLAVVDLRDGFDRGRFRLAGTRLRDIYGREITGLHLTEVYAGCHAAPWQTVHSRVATDAVCAQGIARGPAEGREHVVLHWLRLPLSDDGIRVDRILCQDVSHDDGRGAEHTPGTVLTSAESGAEPTAEFTIFGNGRQQPAAIRA
ncbi:MAG: PAS domain-containing protein [Methyloceanibacter sp.]|nr:PAS domain-containing protein [Methyloceanibacter sp.]